MPNYGTYATLADLKTALGITDTTDDTRLLGILEDASRGVDQWCGRHFYVVTATRTFTARWADRLLLPYDLLSITTLKHDEDDDWDYDYTWATTDYHVRPFNEYPKWEIRTKSGGDYSFPSQEEGVQIVGLWGYGDGDSATPYADSTTDTAEELDGSETGVDVVSGTVFSPGNTILVESEQMYVTAVATNTLTVIRGVNGTTAATHATGKDVYKYTYPRDIRRACIRLAQRTYRLESAPFGVSGGGEMGTVDVVASQDRDIWGWLNPFRRVVVG